jgi:hypothetical protein
MARKRSAPTPPPPAVESSEDKDPGLGDGESEEEVANSLLVAADPKNTEQSEASEDEEEADDEEDGEAGGGEEEEAGDAEAEVNRTRCLPWSMEDEIYLLQAIAAHHREHGQLPQPAQLKAALAGSVNRSDSLKQLENKVKNLKSFYARAVDRGGLTSKSKDRDRRIFPLCKKIWGSLDKPANRTARLHDKPADGTARRHDKPADGTTRRSHRLANGTARRNDQPADGTARLPNKWADSTTYARHHDKMADDTASRHDKPPDGTTRCSDRLDGTARRSDKPAHRPDKPAHSAARHCDKPADGTVCHPDKPVDDGTVGDKLANGTDKLADDGTVRHHDKLANGTVRRCARPLNATAPTEFGKMCEAYPYLAEEVKALDRQRPGLFKRAFCMIDSDKADSLNQKIKKQRVKQIKVERHRISLNMKVTKTLLHLVQ